MINKKVILINGFARLQSSAAHRLASWAFKVIFLFQDDKSRYFSPSINKTVVSPYF
jgi:hypothetical protein